MKTLEQPLKVLIVGAGPTGLTAALELARHGIKAEVVDKKAEPSSLSRAVGIMPASIDLLHPTGVGEAVLAEGIPLQKVMFHRGERRLMALDFSDIATRDNTIIGLPQDRTETLMREGLSQLGVEVLYDKAVTGINNTAERAEVVFADGSSGTYDWVIAADGVHSTLRTQLRIPFTGYDLPEDWSIADVDISEQYASGLFSIWLSQDGRPTVVVPIGEQRVRVISATDDALASLPASALSGIEVLHVRRSGTFNIAIRQAENYVKGRVLLAGDAAHCHSPVGGRGMNLGIADAVAAAQAIIQGKPDDYHCERHLAGARVIRQTERVRKIMCSTHPVVKLFLSLMFGLVGRMLFMKWRVFKQMTSI